MEWYSKLEQDVVPIAYEAARAISSKVKYAQIELENGSVAIVIPFGERLTVAEQQSIESAVRSSLVRVVADPTRLAVRFRTEFRHFYTPHLEGVRQTPNVLGSLHDVLHFPIPASAIVGLRRVFDLLFKKAKTANYVASTALGGIAPLSFLVRRLDDEERPADQNNWSSFYDDLRDKFHLFPGLNWSGTDSEKNQLFIWLAGLHDGASVLLFDTGTSGNGVRQIANLVRQRAATVPRFGPGEVIVVGVVDGIDEAQRDVDEVIDTANGKTRLVVSFERVPRMLTEDCQQLLGYASHRKEMMLKPLRANAVFEIIDDDGQLIYSCGALGADSLLRSIIRMKKPPSPGDADNADYMNQVISFAVSYFSLGKEYDMLSNAVDYGLIDRKTAQSIMGGMAVKYSGSLGLEKPPEWDFEAKKPGARKKNASSQGDEEEGAETISCPPLGVHPMNRASAEQSLVCILLSGSHNGMGVFTSGDRVITARHCVNHAIGRPGTVIQVASFTNPTLVIDMELEWFDNDYHSDVAVLKPLSQGNALTDFTLSLKTATVRVPVTGKRVPVHICRHDTGWANGTVSLIEQDQEMVDIMSDPVIVAHGGTSGTPVYDDAGEVLGVAMLSAADATPYPGVEPSVVNVPPVMSSFGSIPPDVFARIANP